MRCIFFFKVMLTRDKFCEPRQDLLCCFHNGGIFAWELETRSRREKVRMRQRLIGQGS